MSIKIIGLTNEFFVNSSSSGSSSSSGATFDSNIDKPTVTVADDPSYFVRFTTSAFSGNGTHISTDYIVYAQSDLNRLNPLLNITKTDEKIQYTALPSDFDGSTGETALLVEARHKSDLGAYSPWSSAVNFTLVVPTPTIDSIANDSGNSQTVITTSAYTGDGTHAETDWELFEYYDDVNSATPVFTSYNDTSNLTSITVAHSSLTGGSGRYKVRARHRNNFATPLVTSYSTPSNHLTDPIFTAEFVAGYFGGAGLRDIEGVVFASETSLSISTILSSGRNYPGSANSAEKGYFAGGHSGSAYQGVIDGIQFSDETAISPSISLSLARQRTAGVNSTTKGYFGGGHNGANRDTIDGIQFSNETEINPSATLSVARYSPAGVNSGVKGYFGGGYDSPSRIDIIDGIQFSNETEINPSATLSVARYEMVGVSSAEKGYFAGGNGGSSYSSIINDLEFASEALLSLSATLLTARSRGAGANSNLAGYFAGGSNGSYLNTMERVDFENEAVSELTATLATAMSFIAGVQSGGIL